MNLTFNIPVFIVLLLALAATGISVYIYRHTVPPVSPGKRYLLISLRSLALICILLALFEPLLTLTSTDIQKPAIAVLVDNSLSMSYTDRTGSRETIVRKILNSDQFRDLASAASLNILKFSHSTAPLVPESLVIDGGITDISSALQSAQKISPAQLQGIILISDGNYNAGMNPLYDAERSRIPVFTVGVGDTIEQKDISVSKLVTNSIGYVETTIPVDAVIKASGVAAAVVSVSLLEEGKKIDEKNLEIASPEGTITELPVQFSYTPKSDGTKKLSVAVSRVAGELTEQNNIRSSLVKILKSRMKIVVVAGAPSADVSAVMQSFRGDKNIEATLFTQSLNGELRTLTPNTTVEQALTTADCLVLAGFPTSQSSSSTMQAIVSAVRSRSLSTLFLASRTLDMQRVRQLESLFPFAVASERIDEQSVLPVVPQQHKYHSLVQPDPQRFPAFAWEKLPPVFTSLQTFIVKPEAQTLLSIKIQGVNLPTPLLVSRNVAGTKSLALLGYGIFRWKLLASSTEETKSVFDVWFSSVIRWLATREQDKQLRVEPVKEFFAQGEPIEFTGQVYNENFQPIDNADIRLVIRSLSGEQLGETALQTIGSGRYEGTAASLLEGDYTYSAAALINSDTLAAVRGRFSIGEQSIEFAETKMNKPLLRQIAQKSGGSYVDAAQFNGLVDEILSRDDMKPQDRILTSEFELWNLPAFLSIIILLFGVEWFVRKRSGML